MADNTYLLPLSEILEELERIEEQVIAYSIAENFKPRKEDFHAVTVMKVKLDGIARMLVRIVGYWVDKEIKT